MKNNDINGQYGEDCTLNVKDFLKKYNISENGLLDSQVKDSIKKYGINEISKDKEKKWYNFLAESLFSPFNSILLGIVLVLFYADVILVEKPNYTNIIVILVLVLASTLLDFFEEYHSNQSVKKLREVVTTKCNVIRNGKSVDIHIKDVTIGDIINLSTGSMIPADLRVIEDNSLYVGQSSLTGEAEAIRKTSESEHKLSEINSIYDLDTICFMGSNVISGSCKAVVIKIADDTYLGKIASTLSNGKPKTAFQNGVENISKLLIRFMFVMIPIVFILTIFKYDIITSFTFAVAIAIGITPLLLPVILSSSLSKGAIKMSKKKTIVKKLDSIQSFGAMNILCTDKTGTLTKDEIVLDKYLDIYENEEIRILKHAFLNAYFQNGIKGSIDEAIVSRGKINKMDDLCNSYRKIDEIPFDFSRRRLSVILSDSKSKVQMITKGAVEEILNICNLVDYKGEVFELTDDIRNSILNICKKMNNEGMRVIAICQKNNIEKYETYDMNLEKNMVFLGFIGFLDPPKESAKKAISRLNKSGVRVIVLTGDNAEVTKSVCNKVELNTSRIITGEELDKMSDLSVIGLLKDNNVFVKLSPIQKNRIVRLLKESGNVVGFMGDGINDSPSLMNSDVGISVDTAVDIAKESADIILLEKDLNVLLDGVRERKKNICQYYKIYKDCS